MQQRGLTVAALTSYQFGQLLRAHWAGQLVTLVAAYPFTAAERAAWLHQAAWFSMRLPQWMQRLAGRAAVAQAAGLSLANATSAEQRVAAIETAFAEQRQRTLTPAALRTQIAAHQLDWVRCDCQYIWYGVEQLAREAAWCLQEDGLSLDELAWDSRSIVQQWSFYLDELEPKPRAQFLAAGCGEVLGPLALLEGFPLFTLHDKQLPTDTDPHIRRRAEQALLRQLVAQEITQHVTWLLR